MLGLVGRGEIGEIVVSFVIVCDDLGERAGEFLDMIIHSCSEEVSDDHHTKMPNLESLLNAY